MQPTPQNKSTMWANTGGVDISLDSLTPGVSREKPPMPSMNQLTNTNMPGMQSGMMGGGNMGGSGMMSGNTGMMGSGKMSGGTNMKSVI